MKENNETITGKGRPLEIDAAKIEFAPWNPRPEITDEDVAELAKSIAENGLLNRLSVIRTPVTKEEKLNCPYSFDADYVVFAGNRRLAACRLAGVKMVPCEVFDIPLEEARVLTALENLQRKDVEPIREAGLVEECLRSGMTGEEIAAKIGKSNAWVTRRRKLLSLPKEIREAAEAYPNHITADCLENIAARPDAAKKCVSMICQRIQYDDRVTWTSIAAQFEAFEKDLDTAPFITCPKCGSNELCAKCPNRTGAQQDLFGEAKEGLGKCLDKKCFAKMSREWEQAAIAEVVQEGTETVRVRYAWEMPSGKQSSSKPTKKFSCAYVYIDGEDVEVKYGESAAAKAEREAAEKAKREAANAKAEEDEKKFSAIRNAVRVIREDDKDVKKFVAGLTKDTKLASLLREMLEDKFSCAWERGDVLRYATVFPFVKDRIGKDDFKFLNDYCKKDED